MVVCSSPCRIDVSAAQLPDRLRRRLDLLVEAIEHRPGCSLPQTCQSWAATQGAYRFYDHPETTVGHLLPAFVRPAVLRASLLSEVIIPHDSTSFTYTRLQKATGLGFLNDSRTARGLHLHSSLLLTADGRLLGLGQLHFWIREQFRDCTREELRQLPIEQKESFKWLIGVRAISAAFQAVAPRLPRFIHVMDREGDIHEVFAEIRQLKHHAVIRCMTNRRVEPDDSEPADRTDYAKEQVARSESLGLVELQVPLAKGGGYRTALVEVRSAQVYLRPAERKRRGRQRLKLGLIEVREVSTPPAGEQAAHWWLWTTLPVRTLKRVQRVLKIYKARWRVEEYHRGLKTGCQVEKLRLRSGEKLMKAITLAAWVAARAVRLRDQVKQVPQGSCEESFTTEEWQTLFAREHGRPWREEDGVPTLEQVVRWLGRLGGHLGRKGDGLPGVELIGRGLYALTLLLEGREIGRAEAATQLGPAEPPADASGRASTTDSRPASLPETHQHPHV
jgi:hypothetical protein